MKKEQLCDDVLKLLSKNNSLKLLDISKNLSIKSTSDEYSILKSALEFLVEQGVITKSSRESVTAIKNPDTIPGIIIGIITLYKVFISFAPRSYAASIIE